MNEYIDVTVAPGSALATVAHIIRDGFGHKNSPYFVEEIVDEETWYDKRVFYRNTKRKESSILRISISTEPFGDYHLIGTEIQSTFTELDSEGNIWVLVPDTDNEHELITVATSLCGLITSGLLLSIA